VGVGACLRLSIGGLYGDGIHEISHKNTAPGFIAKRAVLLEVQKKDNTFKS
jgi:hypothetical protein